MTSNEIVDSIMASLRTEVTEFVEKESKITSSMEDEEEVLRLSRKFALELIKKEEWRFAEEPQFKKKS